MNSLPEGWSEVPLGQVLTRITYGFTNPMPTTDDGPRMVTAKDIHDGVIDYSTARHTSRKAYAELLTDKSRPRRGDILLTKDGSIGRVAVCDRDDVCINQSVALLQPNELVDSSYLAYLLQAPRYQAAMAADADGSTIKHIYITRVDKMLIALPPLDAQQAIAEVLGALDDKIAANTKLCGTAESLVAALLERTGIDTDPPSGAEGIPLTDLVVLNPRLPAPDDAEPIYVDMQKLPTTGMSIAEWTRRRARGGARFQNGDTLLARITPCLENGKTGYVDFLHDGQVGLGSTEYIVLRAAAGYHPALAYFLARSPRLREYAIRHMVGTSGRQRLSAANLALLTLTKPDDDALRVFEEIAAALLPRLTAARDETRRLIETRDGLLPLLMSGKLTVKDAERVVEGVV